MLKRTAPTQKPKRPAQSALNRVTQGASRRIDKLVYEYSTGGIGGREFGQAMDALLTARHERAATLGRNRAGDYSAANQNDARFAEFTMSGERDYLRGFVQDLLDGRYDKEGYPDIPAIQRRAQSYVSRITGTANETFVLASVMYSFDWKLGGVEEHCPDCPALAAGSPYTWAGLPTVPKANGTKCKFNCRCFLVRDDGVKGFA